MNTQTKIAGALLLVLIAALTTTATLGYFIYERTLAGLVSSRFEFIARELGGKIEAGLDLGLPLGELENMNELLRQQLLTDDALVGLTIKNAKGVVLFDTDPSRIGSKAPEPWLESLDQAQIEYRLDPRQRLAARTAAGQQLRQGGGRAAGHLLGDVLREQAGRHHSRDQRNHPDRPSPQQLRRPVRRTDHQPAAGLRGDAAGSQLADRCCCAPASPRTRAGRG